MINADKVRALKLKNERRKEDIAKDVQTIRAKIESIVEHIIDEKIEHAIVDNESRVKLTVFEDKGLGESDFYFDNINVVDIVESLRAKNKLSSDENKYNLANNSRRYSAITSAMAKYSNKTDLNTEITSMVERSLSLTIDLAQLPEREISSDIFGSDV